VWNDIHTHGAHRREGRHAPGSPHSVPLLPPSPMDATSVMEATLEHLPLAAIDAGVLVDEISSIGVARGEAVTRDGRVKGVSLEGLASDQV